jgi:hypothetical protein
MTHGNSSANAAAFLSTHHPRDSSPARATTPPARPFATAALDARRMTDSPDAASASPDDDAPPDASGPSTPTPPSAERPTPSAPEGRSPLAGEPAGRDPGRQASPFATGDPFRAGAASEGADDPFGHESGSFGEAFAEEGEGFMQQIQPYLFIAKLWVRENQTSAMLGAFAVGAFVGSLVRR